MRIPIIRVMDNFSGHIHIVGDDKHDRLYIDEDGQLQYINLQVCEGTKYDGYSFVIDEEGHNPHHNPFDDTNADADYADYYSMPMSSTAPEILSEYVKNRLSDFVDAKDIALDDENVYWDFSSGSAIPCVPQHESCRSLAEGVVNTFALSAEDIEELSK